MFINNIETDFSAIQFEEALDSGYSDVGSGQSSPCPSSPLSLSPPQLNRIDNYNYGRVYMPVYSVMYGSFPYAYSIAPCPAYPYPNIAPEPFFSPERVQKPIFETIIPELTELKQQPTSPIPIGRLVKWTLPPPTSPAIPLPGWDTMPYGMEQFWQSAFAWFFRPFWVNSDHLWTLQPVYSPPISDDWPWHQISYSAKVRFQCQFKHGWTSMKGRVVFWYRIRRHNDEIVTEAYFKLYGQQCNRCHKARQDFLAPLWYHEEIENAVRFLATEVANTYYGGEKLPMPRRVRQGNPSKMTHHDPSRCQACVEGLCVVRY